MERSLGQRIALGLQGFGAGVQGRGPEFLAGLESQRQELSTERKEAAALDLFKLGSLLNNNDEIGAIGLLENRLSDIKKLDGDPSDTTALLEQIKSGDIEGAKAGIKEDLQFAQAQGFIKLPEVQQSKTQIVGGQVVSIDPTTGQGTAADIEGFRGEQQQPKTQIVNGQLVSIDPEGNASASAIPGLRPPQEAPGRARDRSLRERQIAVAEAAERRQSTKLSAGLEKALLTSQDRIVQAQRSSNQFDLLANNFEELNIQGGLKSTVNETLKSILGSQDEVSEFRRQFNQIRVSEGLRNLPPGTASDSDVKLALSGLPRENASAQQITAFLRGAAKLARFDAGFNQFKADFISQRSTGKGLNQAWRGKVKSPTLKRDVTISELYATAQNRGTTPEDIAQQLGIEGNLF